MNETYKVIAKNTIESCVVNGRSMKRIMIEVTNGYHGYSYAALNKKQAKKLRKILKKFIKEMK